MAKRQIPYSEALAIVQKARPIVQPNDSFEKQLMAREKEILQWKV